MRFTMYIIPFSWILSFPLEVNAQVGLKEFIIGNKVKSGYYASTLGGIPTKFAVSSTVDGYIYSIYCLVGSSHKNDEKYASSWKKSSEISNERLDISKSEVEDIVSGINRKFNLDFSVFPLEKDFFENTYEKTFANNGEKYIMTIYLEHSRNKKEDRYWLELLLKNQTLAENNEKEIEKKKLNDF